MIAQPSPLEVAMIDAVLDEEAIDRFRDPVSSGRLDTVMETTSAGSARGRYSMSRSENGRRFMLELVREVEQTVAPVNLVEKWLNRTNARNV